ncbi:hypothetical protein K438DRAFT_1782510 [Mycena galopus ATCC 62051]|nr:hypothetical protein K438DRAFT_1782500 [Mycena galopus ATCC 62051]KAF8144800.1 hypothetical protein K438DRAFT_1782510 [Mycena galopus ATCC 62051]
MNWRQRTRALPAWRRRTANLRWRTCPSSRGLYGKNKANTCTEKNERGNIYSNILKDEKEETVYMQPRIRRHTEERRVEGIQDCPSSAPTSGPPPSNRSAALDAARKGGIAPPTAALDAARKNGIIYMGLQLIPASLQTGVIRICSSDRHKAGSVLPAQSQQSRCYQRTASSTDDVGEREEAYCLVTCMHGRVWSKSQLLDQDFDDVVCGFALQMPSTGFVLVVLQSPQARDGHDWMP